MKKKTRKYLGTLFDSCTMELSSLREWFLETVDPKLFFVRYGVWEPSYDNSHMDTFVTTNFMAPFVCRYCEDDISILNEKTSFNTNTTYTLNEVFPVIEESFILDMCGLGNSEIAMHELVKLITVNALKKKKFLEMSEDANYDPDFFEYDDLSQLTCH